VWRSGARRRLRGRAVLINRFSMPSSGGASRGDGHLPRDVYRRSFHTTTRFRDVVARSATRLEVCGSREQIHGRADSVAYPPHVREHMRNTEWCRGVAVIVAPADYPAELRVPLARTASTLP